MIADSAGARPWGGVLLLGAEMGSVPPAGNGTLGHELLVWRKVTIDITTNSSTILVSTECSHSKKAKHMRKTLTISVILVLLCPLVLFAAQSKKSDDNEGKRAQASKHDAGPPPKPEGHPAPAAPAPARLQSHGGGGSGHGGSDPGVIHHPGGVPTSPHRPSVSPQPYNRNDWGNDHFNYSSPGRAYSQPPPRRQNWDSRPLWDSRPDRDDHFWSGGWGWGSGWGWSLGYTRPYYPDEVVVPVPYPVPGPTVYYPAPSTEYVPEYVPAWTRIRSPG